MERSLSCDHCDELNCSSNNNNNGIVSPGKMSPSAQQLRLLQSRTGRAATPPPPYSALSALKLSCISATSTTTSSATSTTTSSGGGGKRKRMLQRQRPAISADFAEDMDYAADLEENDMDDDDDVDDFDDDEAIHSDPGNRVGLTAMPILTLATLAAASTATATTAGSGNSPLNVLVAAAAAHHKRLQFQNQRPRSKMALHLPATPASPMATSTPTPSPLTLSSPHIGALLQQAQQVCACGSLPSHSLSHQATRSSSASSTASLDSRLRHQDSFDSTTPSRELIQGRASRPTLGHLKRDNSIHSDSSRYSSVDSLLEARKPDPEAILINLGFGPVTSEDILSRIPARFLKPSQVRGIDTDAFVKRLQLANTLADHSVLGYRGLTGNPDMPPSSIVAKIMQRFEVNERKKSMGSIEQMI